MSRRHRHAPSQPASSSPPSPSLALARFLAPCPADDAPAASFCSPATYTTLSNSSASFSPMTATFCLKPLCYDMACCPPSLRDARARFATPLTSPELHPDDRHRHKLAAVSPPQAPSISAIAEFMAQMLCYVWLAEPSFPHASSSPSYSPALPPGSQPSAATPAQLVPSPEFVKFVHNVLSTTQVSSSVVLLSLLFVHRLKTSRPIVCKPESEYRAFIVSLMLANKMLDDHTYTAKTWSDVSGLTLESINQAEKEFLLGLNFELHVDIQAFTAWFRLLRGMVEIKERAAACRRQRPRMARKTPLVDIRSVLEGIVTPLRNTLIMRSEEQYKLRKVSEMVPLSRSASQCRPAFAGRPMLPLPQLSKNRARSSSPTSHHISLVREPVKSATQLSRMSGSPDMQWNGQAASQRPAQTQSVMKRSGPDENRPSKRIANNNGGSYRLSRQASFVDQRLPPIVVSTMGHAESAPELQTLGAPMLPPIQGCVPRDGLYFYSLAASGGHQLMRHQPNQLRSPGHPFIFGSTTYPFNVHSPCNQTVNRPMAANGVHLQRTTPEMWPPRAALSQFSSPIAGFVSQHQAQHHALSQQSMPQHISAFSSPSISSNHRFGHFDSLSLGTGPSTGGGAMSRRGTTFLPVHSPLYGRGCSSDRPAMSSNTSNPMDCPRSATHSTTTSSNPSSHYRTQQDPQMAFSTFSNAGIPGVYSHGYGLPNNRPIARLAPSCGNNNAEGLNQWSHMAPWPIDPRYKA